MDFYDSHKIVDTNKTCSSKIIKKFQYRANDTLEFCRAIQMVLNIRTRDIKAPTNGPYLTMIFQWISMIHIKSLIRTKHVRQ